MGEVKVNHGKQTYKSVRLYRQPLLRFSAIVQIFCVVFHQALSPAISSFVLLFTYIFLSVLGETILYRFLNLKESRHIHGQLIQTEFNLTPEELDQYVLKLADIRLMAAWTAFLSYIIGVFLGWKILMIAAVFGSYFLTTIVAISYLRFQKSIKVPKSFFLVKPEDCVTYYVVDKDGSPIRNTTASSGILSNSSLSSGCDFKPMEITPIFNSGFQNFSSVDNTFQNSLRQPANYGISGYDSGGTYTGSPTATGWISN